MSEVHREAQEEEDEATQALLPPEPYLQACRQAVPGLGGAHPEMLDALHTLERQLAAGNKDPSLFS